MVILIGSQAIINSIFPPPERPAPKVGEDDLAGKQQKDKSAADREAAGRDSVVPGAVAKPDEKGVIKDSEKSVQEQPKKESTATQAVPKQFPQEKVHPLQYVSIGSLDPRGDSRALVTLTSLGASIERLELNNPRYRDMVDTSGYLGHLIGMEVSEGYEVGYVGRGTPADQAGLRVPAGRHLALSLQVKARRPGCPTPRPSGRTPGRPRVERRVRRRRRWRRRPES